MSIYSNEEFGKGFRVMTYSNFYEKCQSAFSAIEGFTSINKFGAVLGACYFYPHPKVMGIRTNVSFKPHWINIYGNSIYFDANCDDNMKFVENDLTVEKKYIFNVDPYTGWSVKDHIRFGKNFYSSIGKDTDTKEDIVSLIIRGQDNHMRGFVYTDAWRKISPLKLNPRFVRSIYFLDCDICSIPNVSFYLSSDIISKVATNENSIFEFLKEYI